MVIEIVSFPVFPLKMVISNSYVSLPEGNNLSPMGALGNHWNQATKTGNASTEFLKASTKSLPGSGCLP